MIYQPPSGARDLFPLDVSQKRWIEDRLETVFLRWGYHRIITSTVEHIDTLIAGGAIERSAVIELQSSQGERLGLRPELTASIARAAVARMKAVTDPQRLCYYANVFRRSPTGSHGGQQEYYQAGVELLGNGGLMADAEVLLLLADALQALGLTGWHLILGEAALTRSFLEVFPETVRERVRIAIATLDRVALETLSLPPDQLHYALQVMDLRGSPQTVLSQVQQLGLDARQQALVDQLQSLLEVLTAGLPAAGPALLLDLSLIQPFDYYTGLVFEAVSAASREVIAQGGRYDHLLAVYHPQGQGYPGIGFVINIDTLQQALLPELPTETPASDWLVVPSTPAAAAAAFAYAQKIRQSAALVRVELNLDLHKPPQALRELARQRRISRIAWIPETGAPEIEAVH